MHFSKLRLVGFKSFVDPTELVIEPGLTGIVGPNGCGKSNLVEALSWAMGETSAKRMRGGEMDDVIFGGTDGRPARNLAEVMLSLDNSRHDAPKPYDAYDEIEVVRRIEREAGSGYRVNGREVRARDVQLLFADAATGAQSPAIVSQGRVSAIIAAKPVDRRALIEEAAGITGLHSRRHEAELRLKAAEANLLRLDDVLTTLAGQLDGLKKQARQAARYRRLSDHIRRAEAVVLHLRWQAASAEREAAGTQLAAAEIAVADRTAAALAAEKAREAAASELPALRQSEAEAAAELQRLVHARQALEDEERRIAAAREAAEQRLIQLAADIGREDELAADARAALARLADEHEAIIAARSYEAEATAQAASALAAASTEVAARETELTRLTEEIATTEARRSTLFARRTEAEERTRHLAARAADVARQREALAAESEAADRAAAATEVVRAAEAELAASRVAAETAAQELRTAEAAEAEARAPLEQAERNRAKLRAEAQALTELLAAQTDRRFAPVLDRIQVAPGFEAALGAALGDDLTAPLDEAAPMHWRELPDYDETLALPAGAAPLAAQVIAPAVLARRLRQIGVVEDAITAAELQTMLEPGQRLVSRDGGLWRWDGFRRAAGTPSAAAQRLRQRNRLAELEDALAIADRDVETVARNLAAARETTQYRREAERAARETARHAVGVLAEARDRETGLAREAAAIAQRHAALAADAERIASDLAATRQDGDGAAAALALLPDSAIARAAAETLREQLAARRRHQVACQGEHDALLREAALRRQRLEACSGEIASWQARADAAARQRATLDIRREDVLRERATLERRPAEIAAQRDALAATIAQSTERRNAASDRLAAGETQLAAAERAAKATDAALAAEREARVRCEARRDQAQEAQQDLARQIGERLECLPEAILAAAGIAADEALPTIEDATHRCERLVRERDTMGPVNLVAETEAQQVEERLQALTGERDDLVAAIAKLRHGIQALNREGRERLLVAYTQVDEHFQQLFTRLFGGGHAHLRLDYAEGEDPLEAGLEIMASPPGKKLQVLSLLSGGEQALTALALLFAVFLTNPAPICVLDEVDAPLDDANVDRFCRLVEEIAETCETRFLICTHHRLTMSRVDRLFGVTMAEKGVSQLVSVDLQAAERLRRTA
ncbi:MAG TPA: chromosome segregation protein SMC [Stellaceae bacterium]|nr:chromosome segregation protein SMC [Stellaceae bacterium]